MHVGADFLGLDLVRELERPVDRDRERRGAPALVAETDPFAAETSKQLAAKSPTALKIGYRQIRTGRGLGFDDCMRMEWRMVNRVIAGHDFYEGTRAAVIDKDRNPRWQPARLEDVSGAEVARYFAPLPGDELHFDWEA